MSRILSAFLLLLLISQPSSSGSIRIATWNVQNYLLQNRYVHGKFRFQYPKPEQEKAGLRELLLETRPDVLFLQEIGSEAFLLELRMDLAAGGLNYEYMHCAHIPEARSGLAVLSRIPFQSVIFHDAVPVLAGHSSANMSRGIHEVSLSIEGCSFRFFHVHLKSRFSNDPGDPESRDFRSAELAAFSSFLRSCLSITSGNRHAFNFLVGDFNTPFLSPLLQPLKSGWVPLAAADSAGGDWTYLFHRTQSHDRIDGFWTRPASNLDCLAARVVSSPVRSPSDHRLVLLDIPTESLSPPPN